MQYLRQVGQLTVIQKPNKRNTIPEDFGIQPEYEGIPYDLVIDGIIMEDNLKEIGKDYNWLKKEVRKIWYKSWASFDCHNWWKRSDFLPKERKIKKERRKMKKEIIISIVIVLIIVVLDIVTQNYTNKSMSEVSEKLMDVRADLINGDKDITKEKIIATKKNWDKIKEKLVIYIEHDELEKVEQHMLETESYIEVEEYDVAVQTLDTCNFIIDHIKDKYEFSLKNIF